MSKRIRINYTKLLTEAILLLLLTSFFAVYEINHMSLISLHQYMSPYRLANYAYSGIINDTWSNVEIYFYDLFLGVIMRSFKSFNYVIIRIMNICMLYVSIKLALKTFERFTYNHLVNAIYVILAFLTPYSIGMTRGGNSHWSATLFFYFLYIYFYHNSECESTSKALWGGLLLLLCLLDHRVMMLYCLLLIMYVFITNIYMSDNRLKHDNFSIYGIAYIVGLVIYLLRYYTVCHFWDYELVYLLSNAKGTVSDFSMTLFWFGICNALAVIVFFLYSFFQKKNKFQRNEIIFFLIFPVGMVIVFPIIAKIVFVTLKYQYLFSLAFMCYLLSSFCFFYLPNIVKYILVTLKVIILSLLFVQNMYASHFQESVMPKNVPSPFVFIVNEYFNSNRPDWPYILYGLKEMKKFKDAIFRTFDEAVEKNDGFLCVYIKEEQVPYALFEQYAIEKKMMFSITGYDYYTNYFHKECETFLVSHRAIKEGNLIPDLESEVYDVKVYKISDEKTWLTIMKKYTCLLYAMDRCE